MIESASAPSRNWLWHRDRAEAELKSALKAIKAGNLSQAWSDAAQAEFHLSRAAKDRPPGASPTEAANRRSPRKH